MVGDSGRVQPYGSGEPVAVRLGECTTSSSWEQGLRALAPPPSWADAGFLCWSAMMENTAMTLPVGCTDS